MLILMVINATSSCDNVTSLPALVADPTPTAKTFALHKPRIQN